MFSFESDDSYTLLDVQALKVTTVTQIQKVECLIGIQTRPIDGRALCISYNYMRTYTHVDVSVSLCIACITYINTHVFI